MALTSFVRGLLEGGRVRLTSPAPLSEDDAPSGELLERLDRWARSEAPGTPPPLDPIAAGWAARLLYRGCRFFAYRDLDGATVREGLAAECPAPAAAPSTVWSVDLSLRFLPDLWGLSRGVAPGDPLLEGLEALAAAWPLSSVRIPTSVDPDALEAVLSDSALCTIYVDRVLTAGAVGRLGDPRLDDALRAALGLHPELAPSALVAALTPEARS